MIQNYAHELEKKYMPYAIFDENDVITGFVEDAPDSAKKAAREHIEMSMKFDDVSNFEYWVSLLEKLNL